MDALSGSLVSPALRILPPVLSGVPVAPSIEARQRGAWKRGAWSPQSIEVLELDDAIVMPSGVVFRPDGSIVPSTAEFYSAAVIEKQTQLLSELRADTVYLDDELLLAIRPGRNCYGHIMTEILGSAWAGAQILGDRPYSLLVSSPPYLAEAYAEIAQAAGLLQRPLVNHVVYAPLRARKLYVVQGFARPGEEGYISPLLAELAQVIREHCGCYKPMTKKLYVTRSLTGGRAIANEGEIWELVRPHGFEMVRPESLSWQEQVRLFAQASHLVGPMGSALANAMFSPPGAKLLTLAPAGMLDTFFWRVAACVGIDYAEIRCPDVDCVMYQRTQRYLDRDIVVDPGLLSSWLTG